MEVSQTIETEEDMLTCLRIKLFSPQQDARAPYRSLPVGERKRLAADDPLRLGRDAQACTFTLADPRVSRKQLAFHAYRTPRSPDLLFTVQNLSQKGRMSVSGLALAYLERADLPDKALIRFGEYEMLVVREPGEAKASFEVAFEVLPVAPSMETGMGAPNVTAVMDSGSCFCELRSHGPLESDETLMCHY
ncbi:TRAF-interacting protein with FHA domain-containing protein A [Myripristis murdjan]|uniref:TRAF-interacting protein with FHA domain-containing protein A n=1 Tax=Myripristis murdjan TaxID=586833 RepID=A0A667Z9T1_9TELE|nr:TRAF-interacting protein with FHA domain-containing protein A [Myripristis murdjan]